jgi:hypothetical protein
MADHTMRVGVSLDNHDDTETHISGRCDHGVVLGRNGGARKPVTSCVGLGTARQYESVHKHLQSDFELRDRAINILAPAASISPVSFIAASEFSRCLVTSLALH